MPINRVELVKGMLPDAIRQTPRDTFVFPLDGEDQIYPSYREAATALAKELGLGERNVTSDEVHRRMGGNVKVLYTNVEAMNRHTKPAPAKTVEQDNRAALNELREEVTAREARGKRGARGRQQRSIAVELPQSAISELLRSGRAKVMLRVKAR
jgi:hypothetical protein